MSKSPQFPAPARAATTVILRAHPSPSSFNSALADAWAAGAEQLSITSIDIDQLEFDPRYRPHLEQTLEPDLVRVRSAIERAAHVVVATPLWWGSVPASLKGMFDRALLSGWAFAYGDSGLPMGGLKSRSGRLIMTMDSPIWYDVLQNFSSGRRQVAQATMRFCGVRPTKVSAFGSIRTSTPRSREKMLARAAQAGRDDAARVLARLPRAQQLPATV